MRVGATYIGNDRCEFTVWAPHCSTVSLKLWGETNPLLISLQRDDRGYWHGVFPAVAPGTRYGYLLNDEKIYPDPASYWQPEGVHKPSAIVDHNAFSWTDSSWQNPPLKDYLIYELHVGAFTPEGTFDAIIPRLPRLVDLGIRAIEIMPIAQCPGSRNWGYDGVYPYAVHNSYGDPNAFKRLVNACHTLGLAVILDVVYNHLGPEGNYAIQFAPYFTGKYQTPWGKALNYDDRFCAGVRNFVIQNALYWLREYHIDALRLDAIQTIYDFSARPILEELSDTIERWSNHLGKSIYLIAETDNNDARILRPRSEGGIGLHAQWSDDFHHGIHALLTGESYGYFQDFGKMEHLAKALENGFTYSGQFSAFRQCHRGNSSHDRPFYQFIVFLQNHDQVGNRIQGERLGQIISFEAQKLAIVTLLLSPYIPLLFMGQEYGESNPFLYFVDHENPNLVKAVHQGRKWEFASLHLQGEPPFVGAEETFLHSKLQWELQFSDVPAHRSPLLWEFYQYLIQLRKTEPSITIQHRQNLTVDFQEAEQVLLLHRHHDRHETLLLLNFHPQGKEWHKKRPRGLWKKVFDSADSRWQGTQTIAPNEIHGGISRIPLQAYNAVLYQLQSHP